MSELTKEKIYKRELLKKGATGNNNLERIRSLQNGGGGGGDTPNEEISVLENFIFEEKSMAMAVVGDYVYSFGGKNNNTAHNLIKKINIKTQMITTLSAVLPINLYSATAVAIGGLIYIIGGRYVEGYTDSANGDFYCFNTVTESIEKLGYKLTGSVADNGVSIGSYIYCIDSNGKIQRVNTQDGVVTEMFSHGISFSGSGMINIGNDIYIFGGEFIKNKIYKYNTDSNDFAELPITFPSEELFGMCVSAIGNNIYIFGGSLDNYFTHSNAIYKFDTLKNEMKLLSLKLFSPLSMFGIAKNGGSIYIYGGAVDSKTFNNKIQKFTVNF